MKGHQHSKLAVRSRILRMFTLIEETLGPASRGVARLLGERRDRSLSRIVAQGITNMTGLPQELAMEAGHAAMVALPLVKSDEKRFWICAGLGLALISGW